ncbi:phosphatidate cytidylyltransferase [Eupransor demetentiae]|uniref:Phosphatidate cytidylyltransferase n=1 Tax=Eupransor demetentiae TaxID=3109584 RepID=A0ABM9N3L2_9LACO|nr:Predicted CDP-diglyceride synthetase/phosphatidate cytidylyltransferase (YnbB) [Lactobacillaceae bacterium LMG 33000]
MKTRIITAVIALAIFIPLLIIGKVPLLILTIFLGIVAMAEILKMTHSFLISFEAIISFVGVLAIIVPNGYWTHLPLTMSAQTVMYTIAFLLLLRTVFSRNHFNYDDAGVLFLSMVYIGTGFHYFFQADTKGLAAVLFGMVIVWITDSGAYLFGRKFGKNKLAPNISPNKTWEGSIGGSLTAVVVVPTVYALNGWLAYSFWEMVCFALVLSIAGQIGDLIESALKRYFKVKDSGNILPGHGGILDRFDSTLVVMPLMSILGMLF